MSIHYQCRNGNEFCFCQECCSNEYDEDSYCQCENCAMITNDQVEKERRKDVFKKLCNFFQLPLSYTRMEITYFYNTYYITNYEFIEKNNKMKTLDLSNLLKNYINSIYYEDNNLIKKIKVMIFLQTISLPTIRKFITTDNKLFDTISYKFEKFSENEDKVFVSFIKQFNFCM